MAHKGANKGASTNIVARNCHNNRNCVDCIVQHRDLGASISTLHPLSRSLSVSTIIKYRSFLITNESTLKLKWILNYTRRICIRLHSCFLAQTKTKFIAICFSCYMLLFCYNLTRVNQLAKQSAVYQSNCLSIATINVRGAKFRRHSDHRIPMRDCRLRDLALTWLINREFERYRVLRSVLINVLSNSERHFIDHSVLRQRRNKTGRD